MPSPSSITIELSNDEALVLFEFLSRFDEEGNYSFQDQAEQRVLWDLACILEKQIVELFSPHYDEALKAAREKVRDAD